ncbi:MAG: hypothetical protein KC432_14920, partial [Thermomicrobiales bacterium]|nr:hypothetical protein [Thermomicrobiales bacterium]
ILQQTGDEEGIAVVTPSFESVPSALSDAHNLYVQLSPRALETFQYVVDRPGQRISGDELAQALGVSPSELTGSLSSIRKRIDAANRPMPLRYRSGPNGGTYFIDSAVADVFRKAFEDWRRFGWPDDEGLEVYGELVDNTVSLLNLFPKRQAARAELRLLEDASGDETYRQELQSKIDELDEHYGQLAKKRAGLLRKYDPQSVQESKRLGIRQELSMYCQAQEYELEKIDAELESLGRRELSADAEKRREELHADRNWYQERLEQGTEQLKQMNRDVEYLPPQEWRTPFTRDAIEEIARD